MIKIKKKQTMMSFQNWMEGLKTFGTGPLLSDFYPSRPP